MLPLKQTFPRTATPKNCLVRTERRKRGWMGRGEVGERGKAVVANAILLFSFYVY